MPELMIDEPIDASLLAVHAEEQLAEGRMMAKLGLAAYIVDETGGVLVNIHEAVEGSFQQGSLGPAMETFRYVPIRGEHVTETPGEVFQRCLYEELGVDKTTFEKAGLYFDRNYPVSHGEWSIGQKGNYAEFYAWAVSIVVRIKNPDALVSSMRLSEESLGVRFMTPDQIIRTAEPKRPGYEAWLKKMYRILSLPRPRPVHNELEWREVPPTSHDVIFPYTS